MNNDENLATKREHGTICTWLAARAFGFIRPDAGGADIFCHLSSFLEGDPACGLRVRFTRQENARGPRAADVEMIA
jgi:CspA family cold shock protein